MRRSTILDQTLALAKLDKIERVIEKPSQLPSIKAESEMKEDLIEKIRINSDDIRSVRAGMQCKMVNRNIRKEICLIKQIKSYQSIIITDLIESLESIDTIPSSE